MLLEEYRARLQRAEDRQLRHSIQRVIDIFQSSLFQALIGTYAPETASQVLTGLACTCVCPDRKLLFPRCLLIRLFAMEDVSPMSCCAPPAACSGIIPLVPQDGALATVLTVAVHFLQQVLLVHAGTGSCDDRADRSRVSKQSPRRRMPSPSPKTPESCSVGGAECNPCVDTTITPLCNPPPSSRVLQAALALFRQIVSTSGMDCGTGLGSYGVQPQLPLSPLGAKGWEPLPFEPVRRHQLSLGSTVPWSPLCVKAATRWCFPLSLWLCWMGWGLGCGY